MIDRLKRNFILICTVSVLLVVLLVFGVILALNLSTLNRNMDILADRVSEGGGRFPGAAEEKPHPDKMPPRGEQELGFITPETPFATRHFTVVFDGEGAVAETFTEAIYSITEDEAVEYARGVLSGKKARGWVEHYRYKVFQTEKGVGVVFVDGSMSRSALTQSVTIAGAVLLGCAALVLLLVFLLSGRAVRPIAESYEKQKEFITDASHELKTPLTLILANLDIAEAELGKNEWLEDIRTEGHRLAKLVDQLVALSRMDEEESRLQITEVALDDMVTDAAAEFRPLAESRGKSLEAKVELVGPYCGDEALLRRLISVLLDNAVKYCDEGGEIRISLSRHRRPILTVENTYAAVNELALSRLFDRFYRADRARTYAGGYGVGLSLAKAIAEKHKGSITAYKKDSTHIGFRVVL